MSYTEWHIVHSKTGNVASSGGLPLRYIDQRRAEDMAAQWTIATAPLDPDGWWEARPVQVGRTATTP